MKNKVTNHQFNTRLYNFNTRLYNQLNPPLSYQLNAHIKTLTPLYDQVNDQLYRQLRQQLSNQIDSLVFQQLRTPST